MPHRCVLPLPRTLLCLVAALTCQLAAAQSFVLTEADAGAVATIELDGGFSGFPLTKEDTLKPPVDTLAFASVERSVGGVFDARAAGFQSIFGINAAFAEVRGFPAELNAAYRARAETHYRVRFSSPEDLRGTQVPFEFVINGGELRIENFSFYDPFFTIDFEGAFAGATIRVDHRIWEWEGLLTKDSSGAPRLVESTFDDFGLGIFPTLVPVLDGDDAVVVIPQIRGEILLDGALFRGSGLSFGYDMTAWVAMENIVGLPVPGLAGITDPFALGTPADPGDDLGGPFSPAGVRFLLDGRPLESYPVTAVPEPTSAVLMICGLLGLALLGRHRPESQDLGVLR